MHCVHKVFDVKLEWDVVCWTRLTVAYMRKGVIMVAHNLVEKYSVKLWSCVREKGCRRGSSGCND